MKPLVSCVFFFFYWQILEPDEVGYPVTITEPDNKVMQRSKCTV